MQQFENCVEYFTKAIDIAKNDLVNVDAEVLAKYYMHRAAIHECLGY